jgi:hypothetical protein
MFMSNKVLTDAVHIFITSDSTSIGSIGDTVSGLALASTVMDGTCGWFSITNSFDAGAVALGEKSNIGMVCKADSDSTSLYLWAIAQGSSDWDVDTGVIRLGFVKD